MTDTGILTTVADGVGTVTLNRPDKHNAFDDGLIAVLTEAFGHLGNDPAVRFLVLRAVGESFSAGADLGWMRRMATYDRADNVADARALAALMQTIDTAPKPVLGVIQGPAYGGGVGLVACCDIVVAADQAAFSLSEVRLGLVPAVISPYVVRAIGARAARRYFLTAERFSAIEAAKLGLVHEVVPGHMLDAAADRLVSRLRDGGPLAQEAAKRLIAEVADRPPAAVIEETAALIADLRASPEGKEGVSAFLEKRKPGWIA